MTGLSRFLCVVWKAWWADGLGAHAVEGTFRDGAGPAADGNGSGLDDLPNVIRRKGGEQRVELVGSADGLNHERLRRDVDDVGAEQVDDLQYVSTLAGVGAQLDEQQFALHRTLAIELNDLEHVHQLVELLRDLLERQRLN